MHKAVTAVKHFIDDVRVQHRLQQQIIAERAAQSNRWVGDEAFVVPALDAGVRPLLQNPSDFSDIEVASAISLGWTQLRNLPRDRQERIPAQVSEADQLAFLARMC